MLATYRWIPDIKTFREAAFVGWFGPMGVGAVFIATLARTKLPDPSPDGPTGQAEILASTIQPVVYFLVLTSVLFHGLSIPFFSLTRRVHTVTRTWSRQSMGDEPAWASHAQRIIPGQNIRINRDDDVNDDGIVDRGDVQLRENSNNATDTKSSSEATATTATAFQYEPGGEKSDADAMERGEYNPNGPANEDNNEERKQPVLAEYREGTCLIRERSTPGDQNEIEVEVIKDHFASQTPSQISRFLHPKRLKNKEVDQLSRALPLGAHEATQRFQQEPREDDGLDLGMMGDAARREIENDEREREEDDEKRRVALQGGGKEEQQEAQREHQQRDEEEDRKEYEMQRLSTRDERGLDGGGDDHDDDYEFVDEPEEMDPGPSSPPRSSVLNTRAGRSRTNTMDSIGAGRRPRPRVAGPTTPRPIYIHPRPLGRRRQSMRQQVLSKSNAASSRLSSTAGSSLTPSPGLPASSSLPAGSSENSFLTGSMSSNPHRSSGLRFAPGTAVSSDTAPGPSAYKRPASSHHGLEMTRTASISSNHSRSGNHSDDEASASTPKGFLFYSRKPGGGSGLGLSKTTSMRSIGSNHDTRSEKDLRVADDSDGEDDGEREDGKGRRFLARFKRS